MDPDEQDRRPPAIKELSDNKAQYRLKPFGERVAVLDGLAPSIHDDSTLDLAIDLLFHFKELMQLHACELASQRVRVGALLLYSYFVKAGYRFD
jgi:hypothetical protein